MADSIKIAIDYVSPENVHRCATLTKEFREQNKSKVWKEDVLQLKTMMWFTWQSCSKQEEKLRAPSVPTTAAQSLVGSRFDKAEKQMHPLHETVLRNHDWSIRNKTGVQYSPLTACPLQATSL